MMSNLIFFRALFKFVIWELNEAINLVLLLLPMTIIIYFCKELLVVILILCFGLSCYNLKTLKWINKRNLVLGLTQKSSTGFPVQTNLPYILQTIVCVHTILSSPKVYIFTILYNIICSRFFYIFLLVI